MPCPTPTGIRHEVFALAREGIKQGAIAARVGLTRATVNRILKRHAATGSLVPGKSSGAPRKTTPRQDHALLRMVGQDRFLSARALTARVRNLYGMMAGRTMVNNQLLSRGYRAYRPTTKPLLTANHRRLRLEWAQRWRNLTVAHWQHVIFGDESRIQLYPVDGRLRVRRLPGERFRPGCQAHRARVVLDFLQQGNVTKMEQPPRSPDCNPIEHLWDELGRAISSMDNPPQNLDELRQALLDKWAQIPVQRLQRERREYPILTWHTLNETTRQRHEKNHLCSTKFTTIIFQWHLGMHIRPITHFIIKCRQNWQNTTEWKNRASNT